MKHAPILPADAAPVPDDLPVDGQPPRRLVRLWQLVRDGLPAAHRYRRYVFTLAPPLLGIWGLTIAYLMLAPPSFDSRFTLILPGTGAGSSLNVESIGQAQTSASSAFSSATLSPTENYKRLLMSDVILRRAAKSIGEDGDRFPAPDIKLVDQTNLIEVTIPAGSAAQAHKRSEALRAAFLAQLDVLRSDEAAKRELSDARHLKELEAKVQETQRKLIDFQAAHGLVSLDQFNNRIAEIDQLREKEREARTTLRQQSAEASRFSGTLAIGPRGANTSLKLRSDPQFQQLASRYAALDSEAEEMGATLGEAHGDMAAAASERDALRSALVRRGRQLTGLGEAVILNSVDITVSDGRSNLMQAMVLADARQSGSSASLAEIRRDLARAQGRASGLVSQASQLADLTRDHRIAEAVFSSALARLDTNKADPFASYPLVQTLEEPSIPREPSSPSTVIALAGAMAGSILLIIGFALLWLRQPIIRKLFPNA